MSADEIRAKLDDMDAKVGAIGAAVTTLTDGEWGREDIGASVTVLSAVGSLLMSAAAVALLSMQMFGVDVSDTPRTPTSATDTDGGTGE
jgi:hypothetical protein